MSTSQYFNNNNHSLGDSVQSPDAFNPEFEALLDYLKCTKKVDFTGYKRSSLMRRFQYRMHNISINSYPDYLKYLRSHFAEKQLLLDEVFINVTNFFRDRDAWDFLATDIIPKIIEGKQPDEPIRIWSAGCATGQEICSLLILLAEALGIEACLQRVQSFATDADEAALQKARQGIYSDLDVLGLPEPLLEKYFEHTEKGYIFHPELRRKIVFARHNLISDAPMSKIDLLTCRNVLIYFNPDTQVSALIRFHFALQEMGFLFLGKSEALINRRQIFTPVNWKQKIYTKGLNLELNDYLLL